MATRDPKNYYRALGIEPGASASAIKHAYRRKAKELHPDRNRVAGATEAFQRLSAAYRVLSNPESRAQYDTTAAAETLDHAAHPSQTRPIEVEPIVCAGCGQVTAQPRYVIFWLVMSFLVVTMRRPIQGIFCGACADKRALAASLGTWLLGWWGVPWGPIWSIAALFRNMGGGERPADANAAILGQQSAYFAAAGKLDLARATLEQALRFVISAVLREKLTHFQQTLGASGQGRIRDRWRRTSSPAFYVQLAPMVVLLMLASSYLIDWREVGVRTGHLISEPTSTSSSTLAVSPQTSTNILSHTEAAAPPVAQGVEPAAGQGNLGHVTASKLNVRSGPGDAYPVVAVLRRGTTVTLIGDPIDGWVRVTSDSASGYASIKYLAFDKPALPATIDSTAASESAPACSEAQRLPSGAILTQRLRGPHTLRITNGTGSDGVVKLKSSGGATIVAFYVRTNDSAEIKTIPNGTYRVVFATGQRWSESCGRFLENMRAMQFDRDETFAVKFQGNYEYYNVLSYTLHPVAGGTATIQGISVDTF